MNNCILLPFPSCRPRRGQSPAHRDRFRLPVVPGRWSTRSFLSVGPGHQRKSGGRALPTVARSSTLRSSVPSSRRGFRLMTIRPSSLATTPKPRLVQGMPDHLRHLPARVFLAVQFDLHALDAQNPASTSFLPRSSNVYSFWWDTYSPRVPPRS